MLLKFANDSHAWKGGFATGEILVRTHVALLAEGHRWCVRNYRLSRSKLSVTTTDVYICHKRQFSPPAGVDNVWKDYLGFGKLGTADMRAVATLQR